MLCKSIAILCQPPNLQTHDPSGGICHGRAPVETLPQDHSSTGPFFFRTIRLQHHSYTAPFFYRTIVLQDQSSLQYNSSTEPLFYRTILLQNHCSIGPFSSTGPLFCSNIILQQHSTDHHCWNLASILLITVGTSQVSYSSLMVSVGFPIRQ